jgi:outer membrane protein assembly factor BamB
MTRHLTLALVCCSIVGGSVVVSASDWMRFRGPNGTGVSMDRGLPTVIDRDKGVLWSAKLPKGSSSPVVAQGRVYLTAYEGDQRLVFCYDAATGRERWRFSVRRPREERFHSAHGPATPTPATDGGRVFAYLLFKGLDLRRGNNDGAVNEEEFKRGVFGGPQFGGLVRTRLGGRGDVGGTHIAWRYDKGLPYFTGALLYDGVLYTLRNGTLTTLSPETGTMLKQQRVMNALGEYYASPIAGDGKIYLVNLEGQVTVLKAGAQWEVLSTGDLHERVTATPAIADGRVYIRTDGMLYCFGPAATM